MESWTIVLVFFGVHSASTVIDCEWPGGMPMFEKDKKLY